MEKVRVGNAKVLEAELMKSLKKILWLIWFLQVILMPIIIKKHRYGFAETALQDIMMVQGDEALVVDATRQSDHSGTICGTNGL